MRPGIKSSFFIANYYRPRLERDAFQVCMDKTAGIDYRNRRYYPCVIHFPGGKHNHPWLHHLITTLDEHATFMPKVPSSIHILQMNNLKTQDKLHNPGEYFLKKADIYYHCIGKDVAAHQWRNANRLLYLQQFLHAIPAMANDQYFLCFDAADAMLINHPEPLIQALEVYKCDVLFGMDAIIHNGYAWPKNILRPPSYMQHYLTNNYRFLNAGMIFGRVEAMKMMLTTVIKNYNGVFSHKSDQHYYHHMRFLFPNAIGVDYQKKYLLNIFPFRSFFESYQHA